MEEQIINNLSTLLSPALLARAQTTQYFEQFKNSERGWQLCATALLSQRYSADPQARFFCCQVLEHFVHKKYPQQCVLYQQDMKKLLLDIFNIMAVENEKNFIKNKVSQVISLVFVVDYPHAWPSFFTDILSKLDSGSPCVVDLYLRILRAIDTEVVDREVAHTIAEQQRNTKIKDTMREQCVPALVESWYQIMSSYQSSQPEVVCLSLSVMGLYVSWIDINLVVNGPMVTLLLQFLRMPLLRESTCDCLYEIVLKGMPAPDKTKLIQTLTTVLESVGVMYPDEDEEGDFVAKLSKLVNGMGLQLTQAWDKLVRGAQRLHASETLEALNAKIPLMLRFLGDEDDDVSVGVTGFVSEYISILKQLSPMTEQQKKCIQDIILVILKKMKYDDDYNFDEDDEEEAMFQDYRKQLKIIFNSLTSLDTESMLSTVQNVLNSVVREWEQRDWKEVEVGLTLLYMLGEALPSVSYTTNDGKPTEIQDMMLTVVASNVCSHPHQAVKVQFYETVVRYDKFFLSQPSCIYPVLAAFLDERGLKCDSKPVRSRTSYLLSRFIRTVKEHLGQHTEFILKALEDLLVVKVPGNGAGRWLTSDEQMFLYEVASSLIVSSEFDNEKKLCLMKLLLGPVVQTFDNLYSKLCAEKDEAAQEELAECLHCSMTFALRATKGFTNTLTMDSCGCTKIFMELLTIFTQVLGSPVQRQFLQSSLKQYFHRMVVCLNKEVLPMMASALQHILKEPTHKDLCDFMPLITQLVTKFKGELAPWLCDVFGPLIKAMFDVLSQPLDEDDSVARDERQSLRRVLFSFFAVTVCNDLAIVFEKQNFADLQHILFTIIRSATELPDPQAQKSCFATLKRMVELWGGSSEHSGFDDFIMKNILPACFSAPSKASFDLSDGQTMLVLNEIAGCIKVIYAKQSSEVISVLQQQYFQELRMDSTTGQKLIESLNGDQKKLKNVLKDFYTKARSES